MFGNILHEWLIHIREKDKFCNGGKSDLPDSDPPPDPGSMGSASAGGVLKALPSIAAVEPSSSSSSSLPVLKWKIF